MGFWLKAAKWLYAKSKDGKLLIDVQKGILVEIAVFGVVTAAVWSMGCLSGF
ncbi:hypothetical protein [Archaeoglobus veneficus]|uniref:hypothetical protein n=1 Tax=Archaeoglobus veneficus TaxID=58290 RepID=UPI0012EA97DF|nr:hypothetical protein [Archaeoglobus veneficus]